MKLRTLNSKFSVIVVVGMFVTLSIITSYITITNRDFARQNAEEKAILTGRNYVAEMKKSMETAMTEARVIAHFSANNVASGKSLTRKQTNTLLGEILLNNPEILGVSLCWEPNAFDGKDVQFANKPEHDATGRYIPYVTRRDNGYVVEALIDYDNENLSSWYWKPKRTKQEYVTEPIHYPIQGVDVFMISMMVPILKDSIFLGTSGCDIAIDFMQSKIKTTKIFDGEALTTIISHEGTIIASSMHDSLVGKSWKDLYPASYADKLMNIKTASPKQHYEKDYLVIQEPFFIGLSPLAWQIEIKVPLSKIYHESNKQLLRVIVLGIILSVISILVLIFFIYRVTKPLGQITKVALAVSEGKLYETVVVKQQDEIGVMARAINSMVEKLRKVVSDIANGAGNIASASSEIMASSESVAKGAQQQAASSEEISASMEEMISSISQNTENALATEKYAEKAAIDISEGQRSFEVTLEAMKNIASKILIISEIADRTDLLAVNAAIEAARAGESGKGFSVVAAEVRKLAENSRIAAKEINEVSAAMTLLAEKSSLLLRDLVPTVQNTSRLVNQISATSNEQNDGAQQINISIQLLTNIIQQNSAVAEELATSSAELQSQSEVLKETISYFRLDKKATSNKIADVRSQINHLMETLKDLEEESETSVADKDTHTKTSTKTHNDNIYEPKSKSTNKGVYIALDTEDDKFDNYN